MNGRIIKKRKDKDRTIGFWKKSLFAGLTVGIAEGRWGLGFYSKILKASFLRFNIF